MINEQSTDPKEVIAHTNFGDLKSLNSLIGKLVEDPAAEDIESIDKPEKVLSDEDLVLIHRVGEYYDQLLIGLFDEEELNPYNVISRIRALAEDEAAQMKHMGGKSFPGHLRDLQWGKNLIMDYDFLDGWDEMDEGYVYNNSIAAVVRRYLDYADMMEENGHVVAQTFFLQLASCHTSTFGNTFGTLLGGEELQERIIGEDIDLRLLAVLETLVPTSEEADDA